MHLCYCQLITNIGKAKGISSSHQVFSLFLITYDKLLPHIKIFSIFLLVCHHASTEKINENIEATKLLDAPTHFDREMGVLVALLEALNSWTLDYPDCLRWKIDASRTCNSKSAFLSSVKRPPISAPPLVSLCGSPSSAPSLKRRHLPIGV